MAKSAKTPKTAAPEAAPPKKTRAKTVAKVAPEVAVNAESYSRFTEFDIYLFKSGKHYNLYEKLGSHVVTHQGVVGTYFAVWAPNAGYVSVIGNFNGWSKSSHALTARWDGSGIWEIFVPNIGRGEVYKYFIHSNVGGQQLEKADPFALWCEQAPKTASVVWDNWYEWKDTNWMKERRQHNAL
ncbi:MAG: 1,4-alpha-glucan branching enzyme, partial [Runella slithyformis]